jgi:beta-mannosidase
VDAVELGPDWLAVEATEDLRRQAIDVDLDETSWHPVTVPGHWRREPPFAHSDGPLLYRHHFAAPTRSTTDRWWLSLEGTFYEGDVWLDGTYLGATEGYFFPHRFDVTGLLGGATEHVLTIEVGCRTPGDPAEKRTITGVFQQSDAIDREWNPGGLWRPVQLQRSGPVRIARLRAVCREADETRAVVALRAELDAVTATTVTLRTTIGGVERVEEHPLAAGANRVEWTVVVEQPELWWPWMIGPAVLHDLSVSVEIGTELSDRETRRIGLRRVELRHWILSVNGEQLFAKGVRLGPTSTDLATASADELRRDVQLARDGGFDLIRLHGHVGRDETYVAADELGMLVWQDFPLVGGYARAIRKQAIRQARELVDRLGHHPSIVLWCGHDLPSIADPASTPIEISPRAALAEQIPSWNKTWLDNSVKRAIEKADQSRPVLAHSGVLPHAPQLDGTDTQLWYGWHQGNERDLAGLIRAVPRLGRFVTGFGAQSVATDAPWCQPERWPDIDWPGLERHHGLQLTELRRRVDPNSYPDFASWAAATQQYQAELVRRHIETLRRLKYRPTGGFAYALLADAQRAISHSLLDEQRQAKLAYQAVIEACRPVIVVADRLPAVVVPNQRYALDVHVVSDLRVALEQVRVEAQLSWDGGSHRWAWEGICPPDSCERIGSIALVIAEAYGPLRLDVSLVAAEAAATNRYESVIRPARW